MASTLPCPTQHPTQLKGHSMTHVKYLNENVSVLSKKAQKSAVLKVFCTQHGSRSCF